MSATVRQGSRGEAVRFLQEQLTARGYELGVVDGIFGEATLGAVLQFQMAEGLEADGIVGSKTWAALGREETSFPNTTTIHPSGSDPGAIAARIAIGDLGRAESPSGSNMGPEIAHLVDGYREHWRSSQTSRPPWCGLAVCVWSGIALGLGETGAEIDWRKHPFGWWRGSCVTTESKGSILQWAKDNDRLIPPGEPAPVGSIFLMARKGSGSDSATGSYAAGHTGIVIADHGSTIETVDGNVSNRVKRCTRKKADLIGFVKWW